MMRAYCYTLVIVAMLAIAALARACVNPGPTTYSTSTCVKSPDPDVGYGEIEHGELVDGDCR